MKNLKHINAFIAVALAVSGFAASAAVQTFSTRSAFNSAVTSIGVDEFNDYSTVPVNLPADPAARNAGPHNYSLTGGGDSLLAGNGFVMNLVNGPQLVFSGFEANINAIGGDFFGALFSLIAEVPELVIDTPMSPTGTITGIVNYVQGGSTNFVLANPGFFGLVADTGKTISSLAFSVFLDGAEIYSAADNFTLAVGSSVVVDPANGVPEPGSLALLGVAVVASGLAKRRRQV